MKLRDGVTLPKDVREQVINILAEEDVACSMDDAKHFIADAVLDGWKGLNQFTDAELVEEFGDRLKMREDPQVPAWLPYNEVEAALRPFTTEDA